MPFESEQKRIAFLEEVKAGTGWIYERIIWLLEVKGLTEGQVYWYYKGYKKDGEQD